ncbi:MAG: LemA family protein [Verrucomicrobiota bacterium]
MFLLAAVGLVTLILVFIFNRFVRQRNRLREAWSGIEVQLKRRHDLIPNLVQCVKGYQQHEAELLETVTRHRSHALESPGSPVEATRASDLESALSRDLGQLMMLAEAYPDLKADEQFRNLGNQLIGIEDDLQHARRYYNGCVRDQNNLIESFPGNLLAGPFGFRSADFFEVEQATERLPPAIKDELS